MTNQPFFFPAMAIGLFSLPLLLGLIPRNRFYGIRTAKTLWDDSIWYRANRFGGWLFLLSSLVYLGFAAAWPTTGARDPNFLWWLAHLAMFAVPVVMSVALTVRFVREL